MIEWVLAIIIFLIASERFWYSYYRYMFNKSLPIRKGAEPFFLENSDDVGILLLHGFSATPDDFINLKPHLKKYTVMAPLLPGHGTAPELLATTNDRDWYSAAEQALIKLQKKTKKVVIVGNSFGANLAVILARNYPVHGIVLLGMPYKLRAERTLKLFRWLLPFIVPFKRYKKKVYLTPRARAIADKRVHYSMIPMNSLTAFYRIVVRSKKALKHLHMPVLVMESTNDHYLAPNNGVLLYSKIASHQKRLVHVRDAYHVLLSDDQVIPSVCKEILDFIQSITTGVPIEEKVQVLEH